jgi:hypothetical protein
MPPLPHFARTGFDIMQSEVVDWLAAQPEVRQAVFNWCKNNGAITFDLTERRWRGVAWTAGTQSGKAVTLNST